MACPASSTIPEYSSGSRIEIAALRGGTGISHTAMLSTALFSLAQSGNPRHDGRGEFCDAGSFSRCCIDEGRSLPVVVVQRETSLAKASCRSFEHVCPHLGQTGNLIVRDMVVEVDVVLQK